MWPVFRAGGSSARTRIVVERKGSDSPDVIIAALADRLSVVLSYQKQTKKGIEQTYLFRTYNNFHKGASGKERLLDRNPGLAQDIPIYQVARATSAAPTYFKPPKINDLEYLDGGFGANNPCIEIYDEVRKMMNNSESCINIIVSIGCGRNNELARFAGHGITRYWNYLNFAKKWASDSEKTHLDMEKKLKHSNHKFNYHRLNVEEGLAEMKLDAWNARGAMRVNLGRWVGRLRSAKLSPGTVRERPGHSQEKGMSANAKILADPHSSQEGIPKWLQPRNKTLEEITRCTEDYLQNPEVQQSIKECAHILVNCRRARARMDPQRWEKACFGAWYQCTKDSCPRAEKQYHTRDAIRSHLKGKHNFSSNHKEGRKALDEAINACKIMVR